MKESKELKKLKKEYERVCNKLEQLNEKAFELEKEIMNQQRKEGVI